MKNKIFSYFQKHWILYSILIYFSSLIGIIIRVLNLNNPYSWLVISILSLLSLFVIFINNYGSKCYYKDLIEKKMFYKGKIKLYDNVCSNQLLISENQYKYYISEITKIDKDNKYCLTQYDPTEQINTILTCLVDTFSNFCNLRKEKLIVGLIYNITGQNNWEWIRTINPHTSISLEALLTNPNTASYSILIGQKNFVFYNDKKKGIEEGHYVPDADDNTNKNIGSILCQHITVKTAEKVFLRAILCVNTYGEKFTDKINYDEISVEKHIQEIILPIYIKEIQFELMRIYLNQLNS